MGCFRSTLGQERLRRRDFGSSRLIVGGGAPKPLSASSLTLRLMIEWTLVL